MRLRLDGTGWRAGAGSSRPRTRRAMSTTWGRDVDPGWSPGTADPRSGIRSCRACERAFGTAAKTGDCAKCCVPRAYQGFIRFSVSVFDTLHQAGVPRLSNEADGTSEDARLPHLERFVTRAHCAPRRIRARRGSHLAGSGQVGRSAGRRSTPRYRHGQQSGDVPAPLASLVWHCPATARPPCRRARTHATSRLQVYGRGRSRTNSPHDDRRTASGLNYNPAPRSLLYQ